MKKVNENLNLELEAQSISEAQTIASAKNPSKQYSPFQIILIVLFSMTANVGGRVLADNLNLPLWFDSFGTFFTAYFLGPVCAAMVGISGNVLHGFINPISFVYSLTAVFIGIIVGIMVRKGWMETLFKTVSLSVFVTLVCVFISVILNISFYNGDIGNEWGNGIVELFSIWGLPRIICIILGQFYLDFLDKVITLVLLYFTIKLYRIIKPLSILSKGKNVSSLLFFILLLPVFFNQKAYAGIKDFNSYIQTIYSKENGLSGGKANDIASTNDGILWIGSYEGLYRHNGQEFRLMNELESIKTVRCLYVDDEGRLFVGTNDSGLSIIINESVMNVFKEENGLPSDTVRCIIRGENGLYYVGTSEDLTLLSLSDGLNVVSTIPQIQNAITLSADEKEHMAAVTASGQLFVLTKDSKFLWISDFSEKYTAASFSPEGLLYASTESNIIKSFIIKINDDYESIEPFEIIDCKGIRHINSIKFYDDNIFLCADNGIGILNNKSFYMLETGSFNNSIDNMVEDYQGNFWFTSSRLGLLKMCESPFTEVFNTANLPKSVVNSIARFNGNLYFATDDGLLAIDSQTGLELNNDLTKSLKDQRIRCLTTTKDGNMWICTKAKGAILAKKDGSTKTIGSDHQFRVAIEASDGTVFFGTNDGIAIVRSEQIIQWITEKDGFENPLVLSLSESADNTILAGTDGGGLALISSSYPYKITSLLKRNDGLTSNVILRTINDFDENHNSAGIFIVTSNSLCYMEKEKIRVLSNFPYSNNYDIFLHNNGNLFVTSSAGIFVVQREELLNGEKLDYELLNLKKGLRASLTANSWNYLDTNGDLYLSCDTGVSRINLNDYDKMNFSYRMKLESILIDGKRHQVQKDIPFIIPSESENVEIVPEIINYSINTPFIKLFFEGADENPQIMLQDDISSIIYTNLKSGDYKFHISVLDSKGKNTVEETVFTLTKEFKIYDYWWFTLYAVMVAMLAIAWLTWYITSALHERKVRKQNAELESIKQQLRMGNETIFSIANAVEARDKSTGRHSYRVAEYAVQIAKELGFSEEEQIQIRRTGLLHDIGKIGVPDSVLNKPSQLNDIEYEIMKTHTIIGGEILKDFTLIPHVDDGAKYHHEHYDGSGYPNGLKGEEIPLNARIIGIADAFDAMTANRVYRNALDMDFVKSELKKSAGKQFDPALTQIMLELIDNGTINVEKTMAMSEKGDNNEK